MRASAAVLRRPVGGKARDFRRFPPQVRQSGSRETRAHVQKAGMSDPFFRLLGSLAKHKNAWLGRQESNLDMAISKADALACPRGFAEPHSSEFISRSKHSNFENRTEYAESRALERIEPFGVEGRALPFRSPESKTEIAANTGLNSQHLRTENRRLQRSWRSERDSNSRYGFSFNVCAQPYRLRVVRTVDLQASKLFSATKPYG